MIGGYDIGLEWTEPHSTIFLTVSICLIVEKVWPEYIIESDETSYDIFIYKDASARESWTEHGLTPENATKMLYVLYNDNGVGLTIVVGERLGENEKIVDEIKKQLGARE